MTRGTTALMAADVEAEAAARGTAATEAARPADLEMPGAAGRVVTASPSGRAGDAFVSTLAIAALGRLAGNRAVVARLAMVQRLPPVEEDEEPAAAREEAPAPAAQVDPAEAAAAAQGGEKPPSEGETAPAGQAGGAEGAAGAEKVPVGEEPAEWAGGGETAPAGQAGGTEGAAGAEKVPVGEEPAEWAGGGETAPAGQAGGTEGAAGGPGSAGELAAAGSAATSGILASAGLSAGGPVAEAAGHAAGAIGAAAAEGATVGGAIGAAAAGAEAAGAGVESAASAGAGAAGAPDHPVPGGEAAAHVAGGEEPDHPVPGGEAAAHVAGGEEPDHPVPGGEAAAHVAGGEEPGHPVPGGEGGGAAAAGHEPVAVPAVGGEPTGGQSGQPGDEAARVASYNASALEGFTVASATMTASEVAAVNDSAIRLPVRFALAIASARGLVTTMAVQVARRLPELGALARRGIVTIRGVLQGLIGVIGRGVMGFLTQVRNQIARVRGVVAGIAGAVSGILGRLGGLGRAVVAVASAVLGRVLGEGRRLLGWVGAQLSPLRDLVARVIRPIKGGVDGLVARAVRGLADAIRGIIATGLRLAVAAFVRFVDGQILRARRTRLDAAVRIGLVAGMAAVRRRRRQVTARGVAFAEQGRLSGLLALRQGEARTDGGRMMLALAWSRAIHRVMRRIKASKWQFTLAGQIATVKEREAIASLDADIATLQASKASAIAQAVAVASTAAEEGATLTGAAVEAASAARAAVTAAVEEATGLVGDLVGQGETHQSRLQGSVSGAGG